MRRLGSVTMATRVPRNCTAHLMAAGVPIKDIVTIYSTTIRPVIEYAAQVYHPMMTKQQNDDLERLQRSSLKIIYGPKISYREALGLTGLPSLEERRKELLKKFAVKISGDSKYNNWLPKSEQPAYSLRTHKKYREMHANPDRLYRSPLFTIRRTLNE